MPIVNPTQHLMKVQAPPEVAQTLQGMMGKLATQPQLNSMLNGVPGYVGAITYDSPVEVGDGKVAVINYVTAEEAKAGKYGHWICLDNRDPHILKYMGPYGLPPDVARVALHLPHSDLMRQRIESVKGDKLVFINHKQFQDFIPLSDDCGVWSSIFTLDPYDPRKPIYNVGDPSPERAAELEQQFLSGKLKQSLQENQL